MTDGVQTLPRHSFGFFVSLKCVRSRNFCQNFCRNISYKPLEVLENMEHNRACACDTCIPRMERVNRIMSAQLRVFPILSALILAVSLPASGQLGNVLKKKGSPAATE